MPLPVSVSPYVTITLSGRICGAAAPPTRIFRKTEESIRPNAVGTRDTSVDPLRPASSHNAASNLLCTLSRIPLCRALVMTEKPPICETGMQHNHSSTLFCTSNCDDVTRDEAFRAVCVNTTPFGSPVVPLVAITRASSGSISIPPALYVSFSLMTSDTPKALTSCSFLACGRR